MLTRTVGDLSKDEIIAELTSIKEHLYDMTYDKIFEDFDIKDPLLQDVILENFGTFEKISDFKEEKYVIIKHVESLLARDDLLEANFYHTLVRMYR